MFFGPPVDEVAGVQGDAEKIGGNETKLRGADTNDTNDSAVEGGHDPTLPELLANQHGGKNRQNAGQVIESNHLDDIQHVGSMRQSRSLMEQSAGTLRFAALLLKMIDCQEGAIVGPIAVAPRDQRTVPARQ